MQSKKFWHNQYTIPILVALLIPSFVWGVTTIGENIASDGSISGSEFQQSGNTLLTASSSITSLFIGLGTPATSTTGTRNAFVGHNAGNSNTSGESNVALGTYALENNTTGSYNTGLGRSSLYENTTGEFNIGIGLFAGRKNTTGDSNVAIGYQTLHYNDGGSSNVAIGEYALWGSSGQSYSGNVAVGVHAGRFNRGTNNSYFGGYSGYSVTTGENNVLLGHRAGYSLTTGSNNIIIGYNINPTSTSMTRGLNIGNLLFGTGLDGTGTTISSGNIGIASTTPWGRLSVKGDGANPSFVVADSSDTTDFIVTADGKVGVGTASPASLLEIKSSLGEDAILRIVADNGTNSSDQNYFKSDDSVGLIIGTNNGSYEHIFNRYGNVGIGTTAPESRLQVTGGGLCVGSDANCNSDNNTEGTVYAATTAMTTYDLAENYPTKDHTLKPGDVVALDTTQNGPYVKRAEQGDVIIGAISAEPGALLGGFNGAQYAHEKQVPVALSGRIDINVSTENGNIKSGDYLELSSTPGVATKATGNGKVIGIALESFSGEGVGEVLVFVELNSAEEKVASQQQEIDALKVQVANLQKSLQSILNQ